MLNLFLVMLSLVFASDAPLFSDAPAAMTALESEGWSFARQLGEAEEPANTLELSKKNAGYKLIADTLAAELEVMKSMNTGTSMRYSRRLFNSKWLRSTKSRYELAGVVARPDRAFRHPGHCGEIRLIYRLAYEDKAIQTFSRLPMTIQAVRLQNCSDAQDLKGRLKDSVFHDIELNLQSVRWPAAIRPDMGGYAEYIMRVFDRRDGKWRIKPLENMPDAAKLKRDSALKKEFLAWLRDPATVKLADQGDMVIPEKFLAHRGVSIAVHGLNRMANRVYDQVYAESDFAGVDFKSLEHVKSAKGYMRKLNEMTCIGCHQSRSIAGFHFLGADRVNAIRFNRVHVGFSNHFWEDRVRRDKLRAPSKSAKFGFTDRPAHLRGRKNERCYQGADESFKHWTCAQGLKCLPVGSAEGPEFFGVCQESAKGVAGDACHFGRVSQKANAHSDKESGAVAKDCREDLGCLHPSDGYPGGLCFANGCDPESDKTCGALAVPGFNPCLAKGRPFKECLEKFTGSIEAGGCNLNKPCRDDFICMEGFKGKGVCAPPYSLFQLRVDGHLSP
jgi:hypothetical protein